MIISRWWTAFDVCHPSLIVCVCCMFMDWGASQSNWSCSVKVHGDLWRLKAENAGGWKDDGPRWGNNFAVGLILFDLYCYERNIMERDGFESMFVVLWSNIYGVGYKWKSLGDETTNTDPETEEERPIFVQCRHPSAVSFSWVFFFFSVTWFFDFFDYSFLISW